MVGSSARRKVRVRKSLDARVERGGAGVFVAQLVLDEFRVPAILYEVGGVGAPCLRRSRVRWGSCGDLTWAILDGEFVTLIAACVAIKADRL